MPPRSSLNRSADTSLKRVYDALMIPIDVQIKLAQKPYKIKCYRDLLTKKSRLRKHQDGLDQQTRKGLLAVAEYMRASNYRVSAESGDADFSAEAFADYLKIKSRIRISNSSLDKVFATLKIPEQYIDVLKQECGINGCDDLVAKQDQLLQRTGSRGLDNITKHLVVYLARYFEQEACRLSNRLPRKSRGKAVNPVPNFSLESFEKYLQQETVKYVVGRSRKPEAFDLQCCRDLLVRWVEHLSQHFGKSKKEFIVYGPTQVGKSRAKACIAAFCKLLRIPCVIVTKGCPCAKNLLVNIPKQFDVPVCGIASMTEKEWCKRNAKKYIDQVLQGAAIIIPNTPTQMAKVSKLLKWCSDDLKKQRGRDLQLIKRTRGRDAIMNFVLIADEADDCYRTKEENTGLEKAYKLLKSRGPRLMVNVTATPVPLFREFKEKKVSHEVLSIKPDPKEYLGLDKLDTFRDSGGEHIYLKDDDLKIGNGHLVDGIRIPSTCKASMKFYQDALSDHNAKGILLCDISNHLVYCDDNILQKAELIQRYFAEKKKKHILVVVSVGEGVFYRKRAGDDLRKAITKWTISEVIHELDMRFGLDVPIFLFGFSTLSRGVSTRSSKRVVTHLQLGLGLGHSLDSVIQGMGRATGNVKTVLKNNLGDDAKVKVLTNKEDWKASQIYVKYCQAQMAGNEDVSGRLANKLAVLTSRRVGQRQKCKQCSQTQFIYEYPMNKEDNNKETILEFSRTLSQENNQNCHEMHAIDDETDDEGSMQMPKRKPSEQSSQELTNHSDSKRLRITVSRK